MINNEKDLIIFLDENNEKKEFFVIIKEIGISHVTYTTGRNLVTLPMQRILKIKRPAEGLNEMIADERTN